jgi:hypothetical protein
MYATTQVNFESIMLVKEPSAKATTCMCVYIYVYIMSRLGKPIGNWDMGSDCKWDQGFF